MQLFYTKALPQALLNDIQAMFHNNIDLTCQKAIQIVINYYEHIIRCMPGNVYWLDEQAHGLGCNQNVLNMFKFTAMDQFRGITFEEMGKVGHWPPAATSSFQKDSIEVIQTGCPKLNIEEPPIPNHEDKTTYFLSNRVPIFNAKKQVIGLVGISIDITQRKASELALKQAKQKAEVANSTKSTFIANMSHDIRTPLHGIMGMAKLLIEHTHNKKDQQYAQWILESSTQLYELLQHILEIVAMEHTEYTKQEDIFSLPHLIQHIIQLERPSTIIKGLELKVKLDPHLTTWLIGDKTKLHRILINLIGNAIKFTHEGSIFIEVDIKNETYTEATLLFKVTDTGIGVPTTIRQHIFERFVKQEPSDQMQYKGYGIGLHIAQTYAQQLGGFIQIESEENQGSTFYFQLTFQKAPSSDQNKHANAMFKQSTIQSTTFPILTAHHIHLLLVEDNNIALKLIEHFVLQLGYTFDSATSAHQAIQKIQTQSFDLVITDLGLPDSSGIQLTQVIRQQLQKPIPIIGLTAHAPADVFDACIKAGMNTVLTKPIDFKSFHNTLQMLFNIKSPSRHDVETEQDLPTTETELFHLTIFPLLDIQHALELLGSHVVLKEMLSLFVHEQIPKDLSALKEAYQHQSWDEIETISHKMKASALYCGTLQLQIACQYLEKYRKTNHHQLLPDLYRQLLRIIRKTRKIIIHYLSKYQ